MAAPAKVNLYLNVIGKLNETYHELDSLVGFATYGDKVSVKNCEDFRLEISGPFAKMLPPEKNNLVIKAAKELCLEQIEYLQNLGLNDFHFYTLNRSDLTYSILKEIKANEIHEHKPRNAKSWQEERIKIRN